MIVMMVIALMTKISIWFINWTLWKLVEKNCATASLFSGRVC